MSISRSALVCSLKNLAFLSMAILSLIRKPCANEKEIPALYNPPSGTVKFGFKKSPVFSSKLPLNSTPYQVGILKVVFN